MKKSTEILRFRQVTAKLFSFAGARHKSTVNGTPTLTSDTSWKESYHEMMQLFGSLEKQVKNLSEIVDSSKKENRELAQRRVASGLAAATLLFGFYEYSEGKIFKKSDDKVSISPSKQ